MSMKIAAVLISFALLAVPAAAQTNNSGVEGQVDLQSVDVPAENRQYIAQGSEEIELSRNDGQDSYGSMLLNIDPGTGVEIRATDSGVRYDVSEPESGSVTTVETGTIDAGQTIAVKDPYTVSVESDQNVYSVETSYEPDQAQQEQEQQEQEQQEQEQQEQEQQEQEREEQEREEQEQQGTRSSISATGAQNITNLEQARERITELSDRIEDLRETVTELRRENQELRSQNLPEQASERAEQATESESPPRPSTPGQPERSEVEIERNDTEVEIERRDNRTEIEVEENGTETEVETGPVNASRPSFVDNLVSSIFG
jgi:pyruvate/2-oxoglutarate dehydrogenase complex dihydrolipoamide acyltransferase (E2) component